MKSIMDFTKEELKEILKPSFRAKQLYNWIYKKYARDFKEMKNLPKNLIEELEKNYILSPLEIVKVEISKDKSKKYLFKLPDGYTIESVLLPMKEEQRDKEGNLIHHARYSICVSSQVGCKMGCSFCLTAKGGFLRNLTPGEIAAQIVEIKRDNKIDENRRVNIVYMGMGEPLDNLENVVKAIRIINDIDGLSISMRRQTISTSGLSHQIKKLGEYNLGVLLAISLHAVDNKLREELMPINKAYNIESVIKAVREFPIDQRKKVMFEYLMIKDLNDDIKSAKKLVKLLDKIKAKVNLIYFNPYPGSPYKRPESERMEEFKKYLNKHGITCTIRESKGLDISAACGQLREKSELK